MILSPFNNLIAMFDHSNVFVFNTSTKSIVSHILFNTTSALFDIHSSSIYLTDSYSLQKFDINNGTSKIIINSNEKDNLIRFLTYSPSYKSIYFINRSQITFYSPYL
jgi:DNA-binding beta-propeller fold protein YncE